jgi:hypothetical protein
MDRVLNATTYGGVRRSRGLQSCLGEPQNGSLVASDVVRIHKFGIL